MRPGRSGTLSCSTYQSAPIIASSTPVIMPAPCSVMQPVEPSRRKADHGRLGQAHDQSEHAHHDDEADSRSGEEQADPPLDTARPRR